MRSSILTAVLTVGALGACDPGDADEPAQAEPYGPDGRPGVAAAPGRWMPPDTPRGWMGPGGLAQITAVEPEELPDPGSRGARLVARYCSQCHGIPSPRRHAAADWAPVTRRMFLRMEHMSRMGRMHGRRMPMRMRRIEAPTAAERREILSYLQEHAMETIAPEALPAGPGDSDALFARICSRCHALPDPARHTAGEWPGIVARMRTFKRRTGVGDVTDAEAARIVAYLRANAGAGGETGHRHE